MIGSFEEGGAFWVYDEIGYITSDTPLQEAIDELCRLNIKTCAEGWKRTRLQISTTYGGDQELRVFGARPEKADEREQRERKAKEWRESDEKREREQYEKLKKKFG